MSDLETFEVVCPKCGYAFTKAIDLSEDWPKIWRKSMTAAAAAEEEQERYHNIYKIVECEKYECKAKFKLYPYRKASQ